MSPDTTEQDRLDGSRHGEQARVGVRTLPEEYLGTRVPRSVYERTVRRSLTIIKGAMVSVPWCYTFRQPVPTGRSVGGYHRYDSHTNKTASPLGGAR